MPSHVAATSNATRRQPAAVGAPPKVDSTKKAALKRRPDDPWDGHREQHVTDRLPPPMDLRSVLTAATTTKVYIATATVPSNSSRLEATGWAKYARWMTTMHVRKFIDGADG